MDIDKTQEIMMRYYLRLFRYQDRILSSKTLPDFVRSKLMSIVMKSQKSKEELIKIAQDKYDLTADLAKSVVISAYHVAKDFGYRACYEISVDELLSEINSQGESK